MAPLAKDERTAVNNFLLLMDAFRVVRPILTMQQAHTFLLVAAEEGCGVQESDDIKLAVRQIEVLIGHRQSKKPGSPRNRRRPASARSHRAQ
jgi:hypothetical protein